jgi:cell division septum initiation protein DivIVA
MAPVDLDRQAIERRDFPIGRRGYDPAAVDAHLRSLAVEFEELQRAAASGKRDLSLASTAGMQVQSIIEAAESTAAEIERTAEEHARQVREAADRDAEQTREDAIEKARSQVAAVARVSAALLERVGSMDAEVNTLISSLRTGAGRLSADLTAVETGMAELYGAASGRSAEAGSPNEAEVKAAQPPAPAETFESALDQAISAPSVPRSQPVQAAPVPRDSEPATVQGGADLDGARLIALNMALNGETRSDTDRYLAENFKLPDRGKLVDEVYAAIEA